MKILGITAEYNPFHNGHEYHIAKARELTGAECCVVAMSGNFTQRGEPAVSDKWVRASAALRRSEQDVGKADLLIELPFAFACNRAEIFARGGVDALVKIGAKAIAFGCESENHEELEHVACSLIEKGDAIEEKTACLMKSGISRAKANYRAVTEILGCSAADVIASPNNILAIEYLKRIEFWNERGADVKGIPVTRYGSGYRESSGNYAGAAEIRRKAALGEPVEGYMPGPVRFENGMSLENRYFQIIRALAARSSVEELDSIYCVGEGLAYKLKKEVIKAKSMRELVENMVSSRYTRSAICRVLTYVLVGIHSEDFDDMVDKGVTGCRVLAANAVGRKLLKGVRGQTQKTEDVENDSGALEIITNINKELHRAGTDTGRLMSADMKASDMYSILCGRDIYSLSDRVKAPEIIV